MTGSLVMAAGKDPLSDDAGHSSYVRAHAHAACRAGFRPLLVCLGPTASVTDADFGTVIRLRTPFRPVRNLLMPVHQPVLARGLVWIGRRVPSPVLLHGFAAWAGAAVRAAAALRNEGHRATAIMSAYATYPSEARSQLHGVRGEPPAALASYAAQAVWARAMWGYERAALHGSAAVYANYDSVRRLIAESYGSVEVRDLPYAPEAAFASTAANAEPPAAIRSLVPHGAPLVLCASSHNGRKGVRVLIEALARARDAGTPLRACLLGGGRLLDAHRRLIARLGLEQSVVATGWVEDQAPFLSHADIFVLPSLAEQSGSMAVLEALQQGVPTIATAVDGIVEDLEDGVNALLVAPGNAGALATALARLTRDSELRTRLAREGRALADQRFSGSRLAAALAAVYAEHDLSYS